MTNHAEQNAAAQCVAALAKSPDSEILIYGIPKGETERYAESILATKCRTEKDIESILAAARRDGWHSFRFAMFHHDGALPDFAAAVLTRGRK